MSRPRILILVTLALVALGYAGHRLAERQRLDRGGLVLRIAHTHLETGVRDALAAVAAAYQERRPGVVVEQIAVPASHYPAWLRTRLTGESMPDIATFGRVPEHEFPRYYLPLGPHLDEPNPYNEGTPLAGLRWRDTFLDGLAGPPSFRFNLLENYGLTLAPYSVRLLFNVDLLERLAGTRELPADYPAFLALCERIAARAPSVRPGVIPLAAAQHNADLLLSQLFATQTQRLAMEVERTRRHFCPPMDWQAGYERGDWSFESPAVRAALDRLRELGPHLQPGFMQLRDADALLSFTAGDAVMIVASSFDAPSIRRAAAFSVGVAPLPIPAEPAHSFGPAAELEDVSSALYQVWRGGNQELALDFLRFLTSWEGARLFSERSLWPTSVREVPVPDEVVPFQPMIDGYPSGIVPWHGTNPQRVILQNLHRLVRPGASVASFVDAVAEPYAAANRAELRRGIASILGNSGQLDTVLGAVFDDDPEVELRRLAAVSESQTLQEAATAPRVFSLQAGAPPHSEDQL
jgi:raffinose/stachyose/melibiose transport system substrate-binding protein